MAILHFTVFLGISPTDIDKATKANLEKCRLEESKFRTKKEAAGKNAREAQKELDTLEAQMAKKSKNLDCTIEKTSEGRLMFRGTHLNLSYLQDDMMERRDPKQEASAYFRAIGTLEGLKKLTYKSALTLLTRLQEAYGPEDPVHRRVNDILSNLRQLKSCLKKASLVQMLQELIYRDELKIKADNALSLYITNFTDEAKAPASTEVHALRLLEDTTFKKKIPVSEEYPGYLKSKIERYNKCYQDKVNKAYRAHEPRKNNGRQNKKNRRSNFKNGQNGNRGGNRNQNNHQNNGRNGNNNNRNRNQQRGQNQGNNRGKNNNRNNKHDQEKPAQSNEQWAKKQASSD